MDENYDDIIGLIGRVLTKEANQDEIKKLDEWRLASAENTSFYNDFVTVWNDYGLLNEVKKINIDNEWSRFENYIESTENKTVNRKLDVHKRPKPMFYVFRIAAVLIVGVFISVLIFNLLGLGNNKKIATSNEIRELQLADGSKITVNINSTFNYPAEFKGKIRIVKLEGEAFFEITKDTERPFIIETDEIQVKVLGTSFNILAPEGSDKVKVDVKTGKVMMSSVQYPDKLIIIEAGQKGEFNKSTGNFEQSATKDVNYLSWKTKSFDFTDENLEVVAELLAKVYQKKIVIQDDKLKKYPLTAKFENQTLDAILEVISKTLDIHIQKTDNMVIMSSVSH